MALTRDELVALVERVFEPGPDERRIGVMVDLPDAALPDNERWRSRRVMAADWVQEFREGGLEAGLIAYRNVRSNNGPLPERGWLVDPDTLPGTADELPAAGAVPMEALLGAFPLVLAPTELSATAPLKILAPRLGIRAATMPGFSAEMIPALRLDYGEVARRVGRIKRLLDGAETAVLETASPFGEHRLVLDLRHRTAHASGGVFTQPGTAGNLPSGEAYIVPWEGGDGDDPSRTGGELPVEQDGETIVYRIEGNRIVAVRGDGPFARAEREAVAAEPAYANVAELGLGVLADFGLHPIGEILLDEKLGLHVAFGRSDHFGGAVGPEDFSHPSRAVHLDRVYLPELQPDVTVRRLRLDGPGGPVPLMENGTWVPGLW